VGTSQGGGENGMSVMVFGSEMVLKSMLVDETLGMYWKIEKVDEGLAQLVEMKWVGKWAYWLMGRIGGVTS